MYTYPFSSKQKTISNQWVSKKDKPLCIIGSDGTGKSTLASQLLKDTHIIHINSDHIKYKGDLIEHIQSTLFKKDILMMCSMKRNYKSLVIDDFHYFVKYDKINAMKLIDFVKDIYKKTRIYLIIFIISEIDHKLVTKIKDSSYVLPIKYIPSFYKKIKKQSSITPNHSNYHTISNLHSHKDNNYTLNQTLHKLFTDMSLNDIFCLVSSEYKTISLNLLQNCIYLSHDYRYLSEVYSSICSGDYLESRYIEKDIDLDIYLFYSCVYPRYLMYKYLTIPKHYIFKYNSYVSKSLIQIHNQSLLSSYNYLYLLDLIYKHKLSDQMSNIQSYVCKNIDMSILNKQIKVYNYYYHKNLKKKDLDIIKKIYDIVYL